MNSHSRLIRSRIRLDLLYSQNRLSSVTVRTLAVNNSASAIKTGVTQERYGVASAMSSGTWQPYLGIQFSSPTNVRERDVHQNAIQERLRHKSHVANCSVYGEFGSHNEHGKIEQTQSACSLLSKSYEDYDPASLLSSRLSQPGKSRTSSSHNSTKSTLLDLDHKSESAPRRASQRSGLYSGLSHQDSTSCSGLLPTKSMEFHSKSSIPSKLYHTRELSHVSSSTLSYRTCSHDDEIDDKLMCLLPGSSSNPEKSGVEQLHCGVCNEKSQQSHPRPPASLKFRIPEPSLRDAMLASKSTGAAYWRYSLYETPTGDRVKVHYCRSKETAERIARLFLDEDVVGFDIEWKPQANANDGIKKNVSLIQLASEERIALFHIARFSKGDTVDDLVVPSLKTLMENPNISKVGVSVKADSSRLRKHMEIDSRGLFELSHLHKLVKFSNDDVKKIDKMLVSLAKQVEEHLQLPLWKGDVRSSDWSEELSYQQIQYAASDSYAALKLYDVLEDKRRGLDPVPPRPKHAELNLPIRLANGQTVATYDEPDRVLDITTTDTNDSSASIEEMARNFLNIALEDGERKSPDPQRMSRSPGTMSKPPEVVQAEQWLKNWRADLPEGYKPRATPAFLRAYSLWYHQAKDVQGTAELLREPPLQASTVANYILEAVRIEKLPFEKDRLRDVLKYLPGEVAKARYQSLKKVLGN